MKTTGQRRDNERLIFPVRGPYAICFVLCETRVTYLSSICSTSFFSSIIFSRSTVRSDYKARHQNNKHLNFANTNEVNENVTDSIATATHFPDHRNLLLCTIFFWGKIYVQNKDKSRNRKHPEDFCCGGISNLIQEMFHGKAQITLSELIPWQPFF